MKKIIICLIIITLLFEITGCKYIEETIPIHDVTLEENTYANYEYIEENGYIKITHYNYTEGENVIDIPSEINGISVKIIGYNAFYQNNNVEELTVPESIVTIESGAFYKCYSLKKIKISESVRYIEDNVFFRCPLLKEINVDEKNKNYCDIEGVLFNKGKNILLAYPEGREKKSYTIPDSVEKIENDAFGYNCKYLKEITFSKNIKKIGNNPFSLYSNLKNIFVDDSNQNYTSKNGILYNKDMTVLIVYPNNRNEKEYVIPSSVNRIESFSFCYKNSLQYIVISKNTNSIGNGDVFVNDVILKVEKGSKAEKYAIENNVTFEYTE